MPSLHLRTLGGVSLTGPSGAIALGDPRLVALLVMLAVAGADGVADDDLLLRLFPDATPAQARAEMARLVAELRLALGSNAAIVVEPGRVALARDLVDLDVVVHAERRDAECARFLADFRLPGAPEFRQWVTETRHRVEPRAAEGRATGSRALRRWMLAAALLPLAIIGVLVAREPRTVSGFSPGDALLVADVRNATGDTIFDGALLSAARTALQQSGRLQLYSRSRLPEVYARMRLPSGDRPLTLELAREVAEREGVRFVLGLQIERQGEGYRVSGELGDVVSRRSVTSAAFAESRAGVLTALDRVLLDVRRRLGESRRDLAARHRPLPQVTTSSLEALRSYADGADAWERRDSRLAAELFQQAIDLDTGFASAYRALGQFHYYHHDREAGERAFREAQKRADRLTEREYLEMLARWASSRFDLDSAVIVTRLIAERYPSADTWTNYGMSLRNADRPADAIPALQRALAFDSTFVTTWITLATTYSTLRRPGEAIAAYHRAAALDSVALVRGNINHEYGANLVLAGRFAEAESTFLRMASRPSLPDRQAGLRSLGYLAVWRGRVEEGGLYFRRAALVNVQQGAILSEVRNRLLLAWTLRLSGDRRRANAELDTVMTRLASSQIEPGFLTFAVIGLVRLDRLTDADSVLRMLRRRVDSSNDYDVAAQALASGVVHVARGRADSALRDLARAERFPQLGLRLGWQARVFRQLGQHDSARVALERIVAERGFGAEGQEEWLAALLSLGELHVERGDTTAARTAYRTLIEQWRDAPSNFPELARARARFAELD